jgi:hypothetical protein
MARLPNWRELEQQPYAGARKWGTGINPIHGKHEGYEGRNLASGSYDPADTGLVSLDFGYTSEDMHVSGYDTSFMGEHPNLSDPSIRGKGGNLPPWGPGAMPGPQGTIIRIFKRGFNPKEHTSDQIPNGPAGEGWENKRKGSVNDSRDSDPSQIFVQTSERQRDAVRTNTLAQLRGTDAARSEIGSRITGVRIKTWAGGYRHEDMLPKEQNYRTRPWAYRSAGTGDVSWLEPNAFQATEPYTREIPADVYQGESEISGTQDTAYTDWF